MKKLILLLSLVLLMAMPAHAETLDSLMNGVRGLTLDAGSPRTFADSNYFYFAKRALQYVGVRSMSVIVDTTITLVDGTFQYTLSRAPILLLLCYTLTNAGTPEAVPQLPLDQIWRKELAEKNAVAMDIDGAVFITQHLAEEYQLVLKYVAAPNALARDSTTQIDVPPGLYEALEYRTAADALISTGVAGNVETGVAYGNMAEGIIQVFRTARHGIPLDSAALK